MSNLSDQNIPEQESNNTPIPNNILQNRDSKQSTISVPSFAYEHGFTDGLAQIVNNDAFGKFMDNIKHRDLSRVLYSLNEQALASKTELLAETLQKNEAYQSTLLEKQAGAAQARLNLEETIRQENELQKAYHDKKEERSKIVLSHFWVAASLYLLAGLVFIIADVTITKDIMHMIFGFALFDRYALAVGVALTTFALKPFVDRYVERPYLTNQRKTVNWIFLAIVGIAILVMLGCLGYFRVEALELMKSGASIFGGGNLAQNLNGIQHGSVITISFVLISILFALAGATCLSIGFPAVDLLWKRWKLKKQYKLLKTRLEQLVEKRLGISREMSELATEADKAAYRLTLLPDLNTLQEEIKTLQQIKKMLLRDAFESEAEANKAWYMEGYHRGSAFDLDSPMTVNPLLVEKLLLSYKKPIRDPVTRVSDRPRVPGPTEFGGYLHEQLRYAIASHHSKNYKHAKVSVNGQSR